MSAAPSYEQYWNTQMALPDESDIAEAEAAALKASLAALPVQSLYYTDAENTKQVCVVGQQYCHAQRTVLTMQDQPNKSHLHNKIITDVNGKIRFQLVAHAESKKEAVHCQRHLIAHTDSRPSGSSSSGSGSSPCLVLDQKVVSLRGTWRLSRPDGSRLADVRPTTASLTGLKAGWKVFLKDGDHKEDFVIKVCHHPAVLEHQALLKEGSPRVKSFTVYQVTNKSEDDSAIANVSLDADENESTTKYHLTIEPGVDAAFITALAYLCSL